MKQETKQQALDAEAVKQVGWYAERFGRDPQDVVNGILAGALNRLRERFDETTGECSDATASVLEEDVIAAGRRRVA
jgi:hypothetical protein